MPASTLSCTRVGCSSIRNTFYRWERSLGANWRRTFCHLWVIQAWMTHLFFEEYFENSTFTDMISLSSPWAYTVYGQPHSDEGTVSQHPRDKGCETPNPVASGYNANHRWCQMTVGHHSPSIIKVISCGLKSTYRVVGYISYLRGYVLLIWTYLSLNAFMNCVLFDCTVNYKCVQMQSLTTFCF